MKTYLDLFPDIVTILFFFYSQKNFFYNHFHYNVIRFYNILIIIIFILWIVNKTFLRFQNLNSQICKIFKDFKSVLNRLSNSNYERVVKQHLAWHAIYRIPLWESLNTSRAWSAERNDVHVTSKKCYQCSDVNTYASKFANAAKCIV